MQLIKMCALIEGKPATIGQCHPGQARLLQKNGRAEFREGKLWLNEPPKPVVEAGQQLIAINVAEGAVREVKSIVDAALREYQQPFVIEGERLRSIQTDQVTKDVTIQFETVGGFLRHVYKAISLSAKTGGKVRWAHSPRTREIGVRFAHAGSHTNLLVPLVAWKEKTLEDCTILGTTEAELKANYDNDDFLSSERLHEQAPIAAFHVKNNIITPYIPETGAAKSPHIPVHTVIPYVPSKEEQDEILSEAGIEPGEWQDRITFQRGDSRQSDYEVQSYASLLREYLKRTGLGHRLCSHEDVGRKIGFLDMGIEDESPATYVCTFIRGVTDIHMIPADVTAAFQMSAEQIAVLLRSKEGREQLFGVWEQEIVWEEPLGEIADIWDSAITLPPDHLAAVGNGAVESVTLPTGEPGESPADRAAAIARVRAKQAHPARRVKGWTSFRWPDAFAAIPVCTHSPDAVGGKLPFPQIPETVVHATVDGYAGFPIIKYGIYRRVKDRLFRVWAEGGWDESLLQEDGTYLLQSQSQRIDAFIVGSGMDIDILAPSGFEGCIEEAETRIVEVSSGT